MASTLTKKAAIQVTAREELFVNMFGRDWEHLRDILGIMRPIRKAPGTQLKSKKATVTLESGTVAEGAQIPYSGATITESVYGTIAVEKYATAVSLEAIEEHGYDVAVAMTDDEFRNTLTQKVTSKFYTYLNTGTLTGEYADWKMALSMAKGLVVNKFKKMHRTATDVVAFVNTLDVYEYIGKAEVTIQTAFGFEYIENFMGYKTVFLLSDEEIKRGRVIATPTNNINLYYIDPGDSELAKAGLEYTVQGETNLIGFHTNGNYGTAVSELFAIMGIDLFAEYIDAISVVDVKAAEAAGTDSQTNPQD